MLRGGVAHDVAQSVRWSRLRPVLEQEEPIAGTRKGEDLNPGQLREEGQATVDSERHRSRPQAGEANMHPAGTAVTAAVDLPVHGEETM